MFVGAHVRGVPTLADDTGVWPLGAVSVDLQVGAVGLILVLALLAGAAGVGLGTDADALAFFDEGYFGTDSDCTADDLFTKK